MHDFAVAGGITVLTPFIWGALVAIMVGLGADMGPLLELDVLGITDGLQLDGRPVVPEPEQQVHQPDPDEPEHVYRVVLHGEEFTFLTNIPRAKFYLLIAAVFVVVFLFHPFSAETWERYDPNFLLLYIEFVLLCCISISSPTSKHVPVYCSIACTDLLVGDEW